MRKIFMSKILLLCLLVAMVFTLAACGAGSTSTPASAASETTAELTEGDAASSDQPDEELVPQELLGTLTDTSYVNEHFGLRYDAPADWYILTRDETAAALGLAISNIDAEELVDMFENSGYVTDFYAIDTNQAIEGADIYNNLNITIQDIGKLYGAILSEKQLAEASVSTVKDSMEAIGMSDVNIDVGEKEFMGKTCVVTTLDGKNGDYDMYQKQVYLKNGSAVACITATAIGEDKTDEMLAAFQSTAAAADNE